MTDPGGFKARRQQASACCEYFDEGQTKDILKMKYRHVGPRMFRPHFFHSLCRSFSDLRRPLAARLVQVSNSAEFTECLLPRGMKRG